MIESPLIGVSSCMFHPDVDRPVFKGKRLLYMEESMFHWIQRSGGVPVLLPTFGTPIDGERLMAKLDGLVLSGGVDVAPQTYGETPLAPEWGGDALRDAYDISLFRSAFAQKKPILGICRGHQLINVAMGGTLFQDIQTQNENSLLHRDWDVYEHNFHSLLIEPGSSLHDLYQGTVTGRINSVHHQAIKDLAPGFAIEARSADDGIIEAVLWKKDQRYIRGVQWHPEFQMVGDSSLLDPDVIMQDFLNAVA